LKLIALFYIYRIITRILLLVLLFIYIIFLYFNRDISIETDIRLIGNNSITLPAFNFRSDESFGIYTIIYYFNLYPKTSYISRLYLVRNIVTEDKKLDIKYLLYS
jgi:hypothetical protein